MLRVIMVLVGAITLLLGGVMAVARARTETSPSAWIAFAGIAGDEQVFSVCGPMAPVCSA
jgi:hypothetical protein